MQPIYLDDSYLRIYDDTIITVLGFPGRYTSTVLVRLDLSCVHVVNIVSLTHRVHCVHSIRVIHTNSDFS